jgi:hypothetical protein
MEQKCRSEQDNKIHEAHERVCKGQRVPVESLLPDKSLEEKADECKEIKRVGNNREQAYFFDTGCSIFTENTVQGLEDDG